LKSNSLKKGQTDRGEKGGHYGTIKVTFLEIQRTDWVQNSGHNVTIEVKMGDIMGSLKSFSWKKSGQIGVKMMKIM